MKSDSKLSSSLLFLVGLAGLGIVVTFVHTAASLINSFVTALIVVFTVSPVMYALKRKGAPTWVAFVATVLVVLVVLLIFVLVVVGAGKQFASVLPDYIDQAENSTASIESTLSAWGVENVVHCRRGADVDREPTLHQVAPMASAISRVYPCLLA